MYSVPQRHFIAHSGDEDETHLLEPLLLPDEYCLAEERNGSFDVHALKEGFHLFGGTVWYTNIKSKIYLTNYRVHHFLVYR